MNMHNTWGPLLVGLVFGLSVRVMDSLDDILESLLAIQILLGG